MFFVCGFLIRQAGSWSLRRREDSLDQENKAGDLQSRESRMRKRMALMLRSMFLSGPLGDHAHLVGGVAADLEADQVINAEPQVHQQEPNTNHIVWSTYTRYARVIPQYNWLHLGTYGRVSVFELGGSRKQTAHPLPPRTRRKGKKKRLLPRFGVRHSARNVL